MSNPRKIKFLDPREIEDTISEVAELARSQGIEVALVGGVAMEIYGSDRLTKDVDVASREPLRDIVRLRPLSFGGHACLTARTKHPVDIIVRQDDYAALYDSALDRAVDVGLPLRVVTAEYLAALKMAANRDKDQGDLKKLVELSVLDLGLARSIIKKYLGEYAAREFDSLCEEVAWRRSKGLRPKE